MITLTHTPLGRLLWWSDQHDAETSRLQHTALTRDRNPCPRRGFEPATPNIKSSQTHVLDRAATEIGENINYHTKFPITTCIWGSQCGLRWDSVLLVRDALLIGKCSPTWLWLGSDIFNHEGKAIPLLAWRDPGGSRRLRTPDFSHHEKVVRFSTLCTGRLYPPRKYSWHKFLLEAESTPGP